MWLGAGVLVIVSLAASSPGLRGSWVHDDLNMVENPHYDDASDIARVVTRHSGIYAASPGGDDGAMSQTYRPFTMLIVVATHALWPRPLAHHLVGWMLHALTAWLLWLTLRRSDPRADALPVHTALTALFLLHPVGVESYVWINGRSDLMAGLCLAGLLLAAASARRTSVARGCAVFTLTFLGSASKETFAVAAVVTALGLSLWPLSRALAAEPTKRRLLGELVPVLAGVAAYALARLAVLPPKASTLAGAENPLASATGWLFLPKLAAIASGALVSLRAATMQSSCWDLVRALSVVEWSSGALGLAAIFALARARDFRALSLVAAAGASLLPTVMIVFAIWLGLDRYLYMPLLLLLVAAAPYAVRSAGALRRIGPLLPPLTAAVVLSVAAFDTFLASAAYRDQRSWLASLAIERPEDPSVIVFLAKEVGPPLATTLFERLPPPPWPSAIIAPGIALANAGGHGLLAQRLAEYGVREYPDNPLIVALALRQRYESGQHRAALELLPSLSRHSPVCNEVQKQLSLWAHHNPAERQRLAKAANDLHCHR